MPSVGYEAAGKAYTGFLADGSDGAKAPGVLVLHEGAGLTEGIKARTLRLAGHGFVAFAPDLFGAEIEPPVPGRPQTLARAQAVVRQLRDDPTELRARAIAALGVLQGHPNVDRARLAAIGHCFGGAAAIELARTGAPLAAVAGFHAGILPGTVEDNRAIRAKILLCHGADDPVVPAAEIIAFTGQLSEAEVEWQLHLYGGVGHSFTNREIDSWELPGFAYHEEADARAWTAMLELFGETLGEPAG